MADPSQVKERNSSPSARDSQAIPAYKKPYPARRSRKAPALKQEVIGRRIAKQNKTRISNELGISRNTVTAILEESNVEQALKSFSQQSVELVPEALRVMRFRLQANSENAAIKTLESTIWPLNQKAGKGPADQGLVLAIQNLMGNVQVIENKASVEASSTTPESQLHNNAAEASTSQLSEIAQVQENQQHE